MKKLTKLLFMIVVFYIFFLFFSYFSIRAFAAAPKIDAEDKYILANGIPITIEAGSNNNTKIKYGNNQYLDLDPNSVGVQEEADLSGYNIYGGAFETSVNSSSITMNGGKVKTLFGGGFGHQNKVTGDVKIDISGGDISNRVFGGGNAEESSVGNTVINITGGMIGEDVFGGGNESTIEKNTSINIGGNAAIKQNVFGGGLGGSGVSGNTAINITGGSIAKDVYGGGGNNSEVKGNTTVNIENNAIIKGDILGGGYDNSAVLGNTVINITGGSVEEGVYGGGYKSKIENNTVINIKDHAEIKKNVYGGGLDEGIVSGNTAINITGGSVLGKISGNGNGSTVNGNKNGMIEVPMQIDANSFTNLLGQDKAENWSVKGSRELQPNKQITVKEGKTFTIPADGSLKVDGTITNNGSLILKAKTVLTGSGTITGSGKFQTAVAHITEADINLDSNGKYTYTGEEITPVHSIKKISILNREFEVSNWKFEATEPSSVKNVGEYLLKYKKEDDNTEVSKKFKVVPAEQKGSIKLVREDKNHDNKINAGDVLSVNITKLNPKGGTPSYSWKKQKKNSVHEIGTAATYTIKSKDEETQIYCIVKFSGNTKGELETDKVKIPNSKVPNPSTPSTPSVPSINSTIIDPISEKKGESKSDLDKTLKKYSKKYLDFSLRTLKEYVNDSNKNTLVSPLSIMYEMGMVTDGAKHNTLKELEQTVGMNKKEINDYLNACVSSFYLKKKVSGDSGRFKFANSIWIKENKDFEIRQDFLKKISDIYKADLYKTDFDSSTIHKMNLWMNKNTNGLMKKSIDKLGKDMAMYIINGTVFEGKWENVYNKEDLKNELFMTRLGKKKQVKMMHSEENKYISDKDTIGFIKNYSGGDYAFVALLPNKEMDIKAYVKSLNSKKLNKLLSKTETKAVHAALPAFKYDYKLEVEDVFKKMGMKDAFDSSKADFTGIGNRKNGFNISISGILHKTHITVDELGTKKGAITSGRHKDNKKTDRKRKEVILNRPFVYIVMDTKTNIPVFMGTVMDIGK